VLFVENLLQANCFVMCIENSTIKSALKENKKQSKKGSAGVAIGQDQKGMLTLKTVRGAGQSEGKENGNNQGQGS